MGLPRIEGHEDARASLAGAFARDRLPRVLLLHGAPGIGKQRLAHWIGQLLVCTSPDVSEPCGTCRECGLAIRVEHPDLHWFMPLPPPARRGTPERDESALEEARIAWITDARSRALRPSWIEEDLRALRLGSVRHLNRQARKPPSGTRQLFLIADAEELVAQEASQEAANALLKTLEEPPENTWFVLTSSEPGRLLPTIRSRVTALHLPPLGRARVAAFLEREAGVASTDADRAAGLSEGSIGRALAFLPEEGEPGPLERLRQEAFHLVRAALAPGTHARFARALGYPPARARGLAGVLGFVEAWLRDLGAAAAGLDDAILNEDARAWLVRTAREVGLDPAGPSRALAAVQDARLAAAGNVNPQLLIAGLLIEMRRHLMPAGGRAADRAGRAG